MASYRFRSWLGVGSVQFCREQFILDLVSPDSIRFWGVGGPLLLCPVRNDRSIAVKLVVLFQEVVNFGDTLVDSLPENRENVFRRSQIAKQDIIVEARAVRVPDLIDIFLSKKQSVQVQAFEISL